MHSVLPLKLGVTLAWEEEGTLKRESHPSPIRLVFWGDWAFPRGGPTGVVVQRLYWRFGLARPRRGEADRPTPSRHSRRIQEKGGRIYVGQGRSSRSEWGSQR
jgi:hypothetical protein